MVSLQRSGNLSRQRGKWLGFLHSNTYAEESCWKDINGPPHIFIKKKDDGHKIKETKNGHE